MIEFNKHRFRNYGSCEMICMQCGYVIWTCESAADVEEALNDLAADSENDKYLTCPESWHGGSL